MSVRITPSFCKVITSLKEDLLIPNAFCKAHSSQLEGKITIKADDMDWVMTIQEAGNNTFKLGGFGWKTMAAHYAITEGDMVVFRLVEKSQLCIEVFGSNKCMRQSTTSMYNKGETPEDDQDKYGDNNTGEASEPHQDEDGNKHVTKKSSKLQKMSAHQQNTEQEKLLKEKKNIEGDSDDSQVDSIATLKMMRMIAKSHITNRPGFVIVLRKSHMRTCTINRVFATQHLSLNEQLTLEDCDGEKWVFSFKLGSRITWIRFVKKHELEVGDSCLFEAVSNDTLKVSIFKLKNFRS